MAEKPKKVLQAQAEAVATEAGGAAGAAFDPAIIITIITTLLSMLGGCNKSPAQAVKEMKSPGRLSRLMVRGECRSHVSDRAHANVLAEAVLDRAARLTESDVSAMYVEAGVRSSSDG